MVSYLRAPARAAAGETGLSQTGDHSMRVLLLSSVGFPIPLATPCPPVIPCPLSVLCTSLGGHTIMSQCQNRSDTAGPQPSPDISCSVVISIPAWTNTIPGYRGDTGHPSTLSVMTVLPPGCCPCPGAGPILPTTASSSLHPALPDRDTSPSTRSAFPAVP